MSVPELIVCSKLKMSFSCCCDLQWQCPEVVQPFINNTVSNDTSNPADHGDDNTQVLDRILKVDYRLPRQPRVSDECKDLIRKILVADPEARLTIPQIQVVSSPHQVCQIQ